MKNNSNNNNNDSNNNSNSNISNSNSISNNTSNSANNSINHSLIKELPAISVASLSVKSIMPIIEYDGKYYSIYPINDSNSNCAKPAIIKASSLEELYSIQLSYVVDDNPDPFTIVLRAMDDKAFRRALMPLLKGYEEILELPKTWFAHLAKRLKEEEKKGKRIVIEMSILFGMLDAVTMLKRSNKSINEIERILLACLEPTDDSRLIYYPNGERVRRLVKYLLEEEERRVREGRGKKEEEKESIVVEAERTDIGVITEEGRVGRERGKYVEGVEGVEGGIGIGERVEERRVREGEEGEEEGEGERREGEVKVTKTILSVSIPILIPTPLSMADKVLFLGRFSARLRELILSVCKEYNITVEEIRINECAN